MTWTDKSAVVMEIEGKSRGLEGSIQSTGERFPSIKVVHHGDNGTQSVGLDAIEEYAEENGMRVEAEKLGDEEDIYNLKPAQKKDVCDVCGKEIEVAGHIIEDKEELRKYRIERECGVVCDECSE